MFNFFSEAQLDMFVSGIALLIVGDFFRKRAKRNSTLFMARILQIIGLALVAQIALCLFV